MAVAPDVVNVGDQAIVPRKRGGRISRQVAIELVRDGGDASGAVRPVDSGGPRGGAARW